MKTLKTFLLGLMTLFASVVCGQSVSPGNPLTTDIHDGFGHTIQTESFTFKANVDLGGQFALYRTVDIDQFGTWSDYEELTALGQQITSSGIDEFTVPLPFGVPAWWVRVHYRYLQDGDDYNIGDDAFQPVVVGPIQPKPALELAVIYMEVNYPYLNVEVKTRRHVVASTPFDAELVLEVHNMDLGGLVTWYDSSAINPVGSPLMTRAYQIYLFSPAALCVTARVRYSHDGPGYSDFTGVLVGTTDGNNCVNWDISTGNPEEDESGPSIVWSNNEISVYGASTESVVSVFDLTGQEMVSAGLPSRRINTESFSSGVYLVSVVDEMMGKRTTKRLVIN